MRFSAVLIANRGEIALRIARAASEMGMRTVTVYSEDDDGAPHTRVADEAYPLRGSGPAAYLDAEQLVDAATRTGCQAIHPGYGFLSENAGFAARCAARGVTFVGPAPDVLERFGDKVRARELAAELGVPLLSGTTAPATPESARMFLADQCMDVPVMMKARAGGGGRGMRIVNSIEELDAAFGRCASEAHQAFGDGALYLERYLPHARHIEVQVIGDGTGAVSHLWERDCSIQRAHQKLVEVAPSPALSGGIRESLTVAAVRMAAHVSYRGLGTFEFLVDTAGDTAGAHYFMEVNPRLQVEHTVTEEVTGVDLVAAQLSVAAGASLDDLRLRQQDIREPTGFAIQLRVNTETMDENGAVMPSAGTLTSFEPPSGPGVRVDTHGRPGYRTNPRFDSMLAKVIAHSNTPNFAATVSRADRALREFTIVGAATNLPLLRAILAHPWFDSGTCDTSFLAEHLAELRATRRLDQQAEGTAERGDPDAEPGVETIRSPTHGTVLDVHASTGAAVRAGEPLVVLEAMKMEHVVTAPIQGVVRHVAVAPGELVDADSPLLVLTADGSEGEAVGQGEAPDVTVIPASLHEVTRRHEIGLDLARPEAVGRRHATGRRTVRENLDDLCDPGTFVEYGALTIAAQRRRRSLDDLVANTPADGLVAGIGQVGGERFGVEASRCVVMSYDYTVLAGTQGILNHNKMDRMLDVAERKRRPVVVFAEGGGGRPGDTDTTSVSGLDVGSFHAFGRLSGLVPLIGVVSGRCFAGNAALLGCCDVVIATRDSTIGMAGPAMIEGGGLGSFRPEEVGPATVQSANGVIDVLVEDEAEAVAAAKRYLSYFQGDVPRFDHADQRLLRHVVPENRRRIYDVRTAIDALADTGSVLELRRGFGTGAITSLVRVDGRAMGLMANNPAHLGGAIDRDAADKMARFLQLCDAFGLPIVSLCDTPGFMVGPDAEKTATVRHFSRMFVVGANVTVPLCTIVLRKGYGLGAQAMAGGSFRAPVATVAWPSGEIGGMGLEGAVQLGYRRELESIEDPTTRQAEFERLVADAYEKGKALNAATVFELDDVIDPATTRQWITETLSGAPQAPHRTDKRVPFIDTW